MFLFVVSPETGTGIAASEQECESFCRVLEGWKVFRREASKGNDATVAGKFIFYEERRIFTRGGIFFRFGDIYWFFDV